MLQNYFIVRCLRCGQKNRIVRTRLKDKPVCGSCHAPLDELIVRCLNCGVKNRITEYRPHNLPLCARCGQPLYHEGEDVEA
jgi:thioredoxin 2